ncbi:MAG: UvrB/UvrC motif-containing protein, partial [Candidatus Omnitrophota bacterium]|nr:UvrB/UvrC motif-containing protein [Candidatus Omnitrophota bacterium]
ATSLIQVAGRAARHLNGRVILYADHVTDSMKQAMQETDRRRRIQREHNLKNNITPRSIQKAIREGIETVSQEEAGEVVREAAGFNPEQFDVEEAVAEMEEEMEMAARNLHFERAAALRDQIAGLRKKGIAGLASAEPAPQRRGKWKKRSSTR